jgi:hypothetical protein
VGAWRRFGKDIVHNKGAKKTATRESPLVRSPLYGRALEKQIPFDSGSHTTPSGFLKALSPDATGLLKRV